PHHGRSSQGRHPPAHHAPGRERPPAGPPPGTPAPCSPSSRPSGSPATSSPANYCNRFSPPCSRPSPSTAPNLLRPLRRRPRHPRRLAAALPHLRAQVPLRTWSQWTGVRPGALQGDLVLHCGPAPIGRYCATLVAVDVATTWTECRALWDLHQQRITGTIQHLQQRLPFRLREWHSDNGSEFINACLLGWGQRPGVRFTPRPPHP